MSTRPTWGRPGNAWRQLTAVFFVATTGMVASASTYVRPSLRTDPDQPYFLGESSYESLADPLIEGNHLRLVVATFARNSPGSVAYQVTREDSVVTLTAYHLLNPGLLRVARWGGDDVFDIGAFPAGSYTLTLRDYSHTERWFDPHSPPRNDLAAFIADPFAYAGMSPKTGLPDVVVTEQVTTFTVVPEPATFAAIAFPAMWLGAYRRRGTNQWATGNLPCAVGSRRSR